MSIIDVTVSAAGYLGCSMIVVREQDQPQAATALHAQAQALEDAAARMAKGVEWDGNGLPPVGAVCEVEFSSGWKQATVFAHAKGAQGQTDALFAYTRQSGAADWNWTSDAGKFRPIRTPEQIAAKERKAAVDEMLATFKFSEENQETLRAVCFGLYDAGYRRQPDA